MRPDVANHDPRPEYIRALVERTGLSQREAGRRIGVPARSMRYYLSLDPASFRPAPYVVQFALESLSASRGGR